ncbi:MAG TPA: S1 RNA-binding domain-containing protein [Chloroflexota bacterium]|nr:S1 RNA-binding domain-containing protein [Chloroflexota bacterium]
MLIEQQPAIPLENGARNTVEAQNPQQATTATVESAATTPERQEGAPVPQGTAPMQQEVAVRPPIEQRATREAIPAPQEQEIDDEHLTMADLLDNPAHAMPTLQRGEVVEGIVARIDPDEVLVDVGLKSEGVIGGREMDDELSDTLRIGSRVLVYVMQPEGPDGHAILSLRRARMEKSWRKAEELYQDDAVIEAEVIDFNKGGLIVDLGVRGFVPISQIPELRGLSKGQEGEPSEVIDRLAQMKGRVLKLKIIELNRNRNRLILSERLALQEQRSHRKDELLAELQPGQVRKGRVTSLASFGAFVDLGGADGLVHISQLSYSRVNHPSEVLSVGDEVDVYVLSIDPDTKKIALSLKKAQPDPWSQVDQKYHVGDLVEGTITKLAKFGAFAKIDDGIEGLIHLSELSENAVENGKDVVNEGERVTLRVININPTRRRLGLSLRQVENPSPGIKAVLEGGELPPEDENAEDIVWADEGGSPTVDE